LFSTVVPVRSDAWGAVALGGDPSRGRLGYMRCPCEHTTNGPDCSVGSVSYHRATERNVLSANDLSRSIRQSVALFRTVGRRVCRARRSRGRLPKSPILPRFGFVSRTMPKHSRPPIHNPKSAIYNSVFGFVWPNASRLFNPQSRDPTGRFPISARSEAAETRAAP